MSYLMESAQEGQRLLAQEAANSSRQRVVAAGLKEAHRVLDAGCGAGAVTRVLLDVVGPRGHVTAFDPSPARLALAREALEPAANLELLTAALPLTGLPSGTFDFVWSQFVFEYLPAPLEALTELKRLARPGGLVAIAEIDGYGLGLWPLSEQLSAGLETFQRALKAAQFDLFVGRKLFSAFRTLGFTDIAVHLSAFHVTPGAADTAMLEDWKLRFETLHPLGVQAFGSASAWATFTQSYLALLADPDALKYSVVLTTAGRRP